MKIMKLIIVLSFSVLLLSCKKAEVKEDGMNYKDVLDTSDTKIQDDTSDKPVINNGQTNEDDLEDVEIDDEINEDKTSKATVIIDDYDITASVSGTPLKKAYEDYFMMGVGLNGSSIENATVRSDAMSEIIKYHFNSVTYSNLMKSSYFLDQKGSIDNYTSFKRLHILHKIVKKRILLADNMFIVKSEVTGSRSGLSICQAGIGFFCIDDKVLFYIDQIVQKFAKCIVFGSFP